MPNGRAKANSIPRPTMWRLPRFFYLALAAAAFSSGAHAACEPKTFPVRGVERHGLVCAPAGPASSAPLILAFHGRGGNAREMALGTRFHIAWPEAVVAYLDGLPGNPAPYDPAGKYAGWQINPGDLNDRDIAFTDAALEALARHYRVDPAKVFAVGHSNGARFVGVLWVRRAARFAALAFSAAQADTLIDAAEPRPVFMAMGIQDDVVPFEWQRQSIRTAAARFGIAAPEGVQEGERSAFSPGGVELVSYIHRGGHAWPAGQTERIVAFFKRQAARIERGADAGIQPPLRRPP